MFNPRDRGLKWITKMKNQPKGHFDLLDSQKTRSKGGIKFYYI